MRIARKNAKGPFSLGQGTGARGGPRRRRTMVSMPMVCGRRPCCCERELSYHGDVSDLGGQAEDSKSCLVE